MDILILDHGLILGCIVGYWDIMQQNDVKTPLDTPCAFSQLCIGNIKLALMPKYIHNYDPDFGANIKAIDGYLMGSNTSRFQW